MKKNQQQHQGLFEMIERKAIENFKGRKGYVTNPENVDRERKILAKLNRGKEDAEWGPMLKRIKTLFSEQLNPMKPGDKQYLLARNTAKARKGKRFVYIGVDGEFHIGRDGKPLKVQRAR